MSAGTRRRIHVTDTPELTALIGRNALPGEPRAATLVRLAERGDRGGVTPEPFIHVYPPTGRTVTQDDIDAALYGDDADVLA